MMDVGTMIILPLTPVNTAVPGSPTNTLALWLLSFQWLFLSSTLAVLHSNGRQDVLLQVVFFKFVLFLDF